MFDTVKILASVASVADDTRVGTSSVRVNHRAGMCVTFAATDGHTAIVARLPRHDAAETGGEFAYRAADLRAACKYSGAKGYVSFEANGVLAFFSSIEPGSVPVRVSPRTDGATFPELARVIPAQVKAYHCAWFDPNLITQHARIHAAAFAKERSVQTAVEIGDPSEPARLCSRTRDGVTLLSVIMPVRVSDSNGDGIASEVLIGLETRIVNAEAAE